MAKPVRYKQCCLVRGMAEQVAWIGIEYAHVGKALRFGDDQSLWTVEAVGHMVISQDEVDLVEAARRDRALTIG